MPTAQPISMHTPGQEQVKGLPLTGLTGCFLSRVSFAIYELCILLLSLYLWYIDEDQSWVLSEWGRHISVGGPFGRSGRSVVIIRRHIRGSKHHTSPVGQKFISSLHRCSIYIILTISTLHRRPGATTHTKYCLPELRFIRTRDHTFTRTRFNGMLGGSPIMAS